MDKTHLFPDSQPLRPQVSSQTRDPSEAPPHEPSQEYFHEDLAPRVVGAPSTMEHRARGKREHRKLVLCFDGTGNKFQGDDSDSNILKTFRCLDRTAGDQYHYYQPGIGTYIVSSSLSHTSLSARMKSWYMKAKDSAVGTSFDHHVVGGYRFLMRFYNPGDEIYIFGFSRGAYVARFLAEMLDYVGLLSHGNEEMITFAWKAFSQWQSRQSDESEHDRAKRREMYRFMKGFRETFSRPVKRIRFLGLFDTVNSVPRFEAAWMQRSKFPYTARTSAKMIRHCVSIDERRAKFRQDLIYQSSAKGAKGKLRHADHDHEHVHVHGQDGKLNEKLHERYRVAKYKGRAQRPHENADRGREAQESSQGEQVESTFRPRSRSSRSRSRAAPSADDTSFIDTKSDVSRVLEDDEYDDSDDEDQDIDEIWFAGGHADIGGGWEAPDDHKSASHIPLVYMIREAQKAGLTFDRDKLVDMGVMEELDESEGMQQQREAQSQGAGGPEVLRPDIRIDVSSPTPSDSQFGLKTIPSASQPQQGQPVTGNDSPGVKKPSARDAFHDMLHKAHLALIHDSLEFSSGLGTGQVLSWKIMEYMPFRRMDLRPDGSWKPIRWPLPCGETRDIPQNARIHGSVIRRMKQDPAYRPGNLIMGGGGRGRRRAPPEMGAGEWDCVQEQDDPIGEVWVRRMPCYEYGGGK